MKRNILVVLALILSLIVSNPSKAAESCSSLNVATLADDNLTVTILSMNIVEKTGSYQLTINYKLANMTLDKKIDEGTFKLFFTDGSSTPQYGFFGSFFPSDSRERSYTWEYLKTLTPMNISYNSGFFSSEPSSLKLNWAPPGFGCNLISPAAKAAADKAAADKAAADKAAADKAAADKAAADKAAADKAAEQIPPSTNVSCSVIDDGVRCGNSITITQTWTVTGSVHTEWYLSTLVPGADATKSGSYTGKVLLKSSPNVAGNEDFSYPALLAAAGNNQNASVLISAIIFNSEGKGSPILGKTVYFTLNELKVLMADAAAKTAADAAAKTAADKVAAANAATDAANKIAANAAAKIAADKVAAANAATDAANKIADDAAAKADADASRREQAISVSPRLSGSVSLTLNGLAIKVSSTSNLSVFAYNSTNNVCEFANGLIKTKTSGRCVIAFSQEGNSEYKPATNFILDFSIVSAAKKTTITCVKGKLTKKVTAVKPVCPAGYKKK